MKLKIKTIVIVILLNLVAGCADQSEKSQPNIILIMTDDQGWGQTGYYNHPVLETPNLDSMSANGLRLDRFYAGAPVCSPTRATVLTGRANNRTGVATHGYALRLQEKTIAQALRAEGYATGHFGKWHLDALRGPGVPILADDPHGPAAFGFERWLSVTNFFDLDPLMSDQGDFKEFKGTSSEVIVQEALQFIRESSNAGNPFFAVIWDGSPHRPFLALQEDSAKFSDLDPKSIAHYGELVAFDRSVGMLRSRLRELNLSENTLIWFCSDNGGLNDVNPSSVGHLRGFKGSVWEGGLRVPAIIEWPGKIDPRISLYPASTMDIFPTIADILDLPSEVMIDPVDGESILPLFYKDIPKRENSIKFRFNNNGALIDNNLKLVATNWREQEFEMYDLKLDPSETQNISDLHPRLFEKMIDEFNKWNASVESSIMGKDYPEGEVFEDHPEPEHWPADPRYEAYLEEWINRSEYRNQIKNTRR